MRAAIENIGRAVISEWYDSKTEYVREDDDFSIHTTLKYAGHYITCNINLYGNAYFKHKDADIEVLFEDDPYENLEKAVNKWVEENIDANELYNALCDVESEEYADEWQRNGFRDAADYYNYRYCA